MQMFKFSKYVFVLFPNKRRYDDNNTFDISTRLKKSLYFYTLLILDIFGVNISDPVQI